MTDKELIPKFYSSYNNYLSLNTPRSQSSKVDETSKLVNRNYIFLIMWFIITSIVVLFTIMAIMTNKDSYMYISLGIIIIISFFTFKNIYTYFNVLS